MSLNFFDPYDALAELKKKQNLDFTLATNATFATNKEIQHVTDKNAMRQGCDKLRQIESTVSAYGKCRTMSHNVAHGCDKVEFNNSNNLASNVAFVANVARVELEKTLFRETVLMLDHNGKPESCIHCGRWQNLKERPWWIGVCDISGEGKTNKSHCNIPSYEEILQ